MIDAGRRLHEQPGADVLVMGCAGMARYRDNLGGAVQIAVVEPTQAAVAMAIGRTRLDWGQKLALRTSLRRGKILIRVAALATLSRRVTRCERGAWS